MSPPPAKIRARHLGTNHFVSTPGGWTSDRIPSPRLTFSGGATVLCPVVHRFRPGWRMGTTLTLIDLAGPVALLLEPCTWSRAASSVPTARNCAACWAGLWATAARICARLGRHRDPAAMLTSINFRRIPSWLRSSPERVSPRLRRGPRQGFVRASAGQAW